MYGKVSVEGFCYNTTEPDSLVYYYGKDTNKLGYSRGVHNNSLENNFRTTLLSPGLLSDLTEL